MEIEAKLNRLRMSPRKVRLVIDLIRGQDVEKAQQQLQFLSKAAARPVLKLLNSAIANAENNFKLEKNNLFIKKIIANEGPVLKRWRARAFGRAAEIRKPSSHIEIILAEKKESGLARESKQKIKTKKKGVKQKEDIKVVKREEIKKEFSDIKKKDIPPLKDEKKPVIKLKEIKDRLFHRTGEK